MAQWDFDRNATSVRLMADWGVEQGLSLQEVLRGTGLQAEQLDDVSTIVSARQELQLIENLVISLGDDQAQGLQVGQRYRFNVFGALGFAMISCRCMREALDIGLRYFHLTFAFADFAAHDQVELTHLRLDDSDIPAGLRRFIIERDYAAFITLQRDIFGRQGVIRDMLFAHSSQAPHAYREFFGVEPRFSTDRNEARLDRHAIEQPLPQANELARKAAEQQCRDILNKRAARSGLAGQVRERIAAALPESPSMADVARSLNTIPRTLRRRLQAEHTSFAELRDEVRQALANEFLLGPRLSMEQVAARLGYADSTSFINAFRRWHDVTPNVWRRQQSGR